MKNYYVKINDGAIYRFHGVSCNKITIFLWALVALNCLWFFTPSSRPLPVDVNSTYSTTPVAHPLPEAVLLDDTHQQSVEDALARENHRRSVEAARSAIARDFCSSLARKGSTCDLYRGKWVRNASPPLYTNETCRYIFPNQDCMTNGRPDRDFLHWKWQPNDCELPSLNATVFLASMMGKRMIFVGDSLARNNMQSLLCSLSQVEDPEDQQAIWSMASAWYFPSYNFLLALSWTPFLVKYAVDNGTWHLHLDRPDTAWASRLADYDVAVFSTGYWFFRKSIYYVNNQTFSSYDPANTTTTEDMRAIEVVWNTVLNYLLDNYKGIAVVRTVTVSHYAENPWDKGGTCNKTQPDFDPDMQMQLPWIHNEIRNIQMKGLNKALARQESGGKVVKPTLRLMDVTYSTLLRPDGHPGTYRIQNPTEPRHDCTHWCQPGAVDTWSQFLFADPQVMCSSGADIEDRSDFGDSE